MIDEVVLVSVPHTGTKFTVRLLTQQGFREAGLFEKPHRRTIYQGHMLKEGQIQRGLELAERMPLVCPLRHPYRVELAWRKRGKSIEELLTGFRTLVERFIPAGAHIFPVDSHMRSEALHSFSESIGEQIETDWAPVNVYKDGTHSVALSELEPSPEVRALAEDIEPVLARYY